MTFESCCATSSKVISSLFSTSMTFGSCATSFEVISSLFSISAPCVYIYNKKKVKVKNLNIS
jgi:hypothetical protein